MIPVSLQEKSFQKIDIFEDKARRLIGLNISQGKRLCMKKKMRGRVPLRPRVLQTDLIPKSARNRMWVLCGRTVEMAELGKLREKRLAWYLDTMTF